MLAALNAATGVTVWSYDTGTEVESGMVLSGDVLSLAWDGFVYAFDRNLGRLRWESNLQSEWGDSRIATAGNGLVYVSHGRSISAVDVQDGSIRWEYDIGSRYPALVAVDNGALYIGAEGETHALDAGSGRRLWLLERTSKAHALAATDGMIYVAGESYASGGSAYEIRALDGKSGDLEWSYEIGQRIKSNLAVAHRNVYAGTAAGVYALDVSSGALAWTYDLKSCVGSLAAANGIVYAVAETGNVYAFDATTGELTWSYEAGLGPGGCWAVSVAVADGVLYVTYGPDGKVYAFGPAE